MRGISTAFLMAVCFAGLTAFSCKHWTTIITGRFFKRVPLPDSSMQYLNHKSSVSFDSSRNVQDVAGEVFFKIKADQKPFTVSVKDVLIVADSAAEFNVNTYKLANPKQDSMYEWMYRSIRITAYTNQVRIFNKRKEILLKPGYSAFIGSTTSFVGYASAAESDSIWISGEYCYKGMSSETLAELSLRYYDIEIDKDPNAKWIMIRPFRFKPDLPFSAFKDSVEAVLNCELRMTGPNRYTIFGNSKDL